MNERERIIRLWFDMWLQQRDLGIDEIFADHAEYMESYGPRYEGCEAIRRWFEEWNKHGKVLTWRIEQFFHKNNQTVVQWYFKGSVRPRLTRKACSPKTRLFDCAERSNKRVEISLLQRQIDDSVQMCKQAFF